MAKQIIRLKDTPHGQAQQAEIDKKRAEKQKADKAKNSLNAAKASFEGLTFDELNPPQKDELLKAVALALGIIEE